MMERRFIFFLMFMFACVFAQAADRSVSLCCESGMVNDVDRDTVSQSSGSVVLSSTYCADGNWKLTPEWQTSKRLGAWGWSCLGVGTAATVGGLIWLTCAIIKDEGTMWDSIGISTLMISGPVLMLSSIPLLVLSYKYKSKARKSVGMDIGITGIPDIIPLHRKRCVPAIGMSITF